MWQFQIHDTATGQLVDRVSPSAGSWTRRLSGKGSGSHTFRLSDADYDRDTWRSLLEPWERTLVVCWLSPSGGIAPVYAGVIFRSTYSPATGEVQVQHEGIRTLLGARLTFANGNYVGGGLRVSNRSPWGAFRAILTRATANTGRSLPFDLSRVPDGSGSVSLDWSSPQLATISDCISDLEKLGYEVDFVPQLTGDHVFSWAPTIGTRLTGPEVETIVTAEGSPFDDVQVVIDATQAATSVIVAGVGSGEDMKVGWAPSGVPNVPVALERVDQVKRSQTSLDAVAEARLSERSWATVQWSFSVDVYGSGFSPVDFVPTNIVHVLTYGDPWLSDQDRPLRVVALAGDMTMRVKPEVQ